MFADLHLHTRYSDGTYTPGSLVAAARETRLSVISVTDHDTMEACAEVGAEAALAGIEFIPGCEITAELGGRELHILGYLLDVGHPDLGRELGHAQEIRQQRVREMVERLHARGIPLELDAVFSVAACRAPGRPHVARALVQGGYCGSLDEAFERFLKKDRPAWVPKEKMPAARAIELIRAAGGVSVLAHPGLNRDDSVVEQVAALGIEGLECFHPKHPPAASARYEAMARAFGLVVTGGSDCHGRSQNRATMGSVRIPMDRVLRQRERQAARPMR